MMEGVAFDQSSAGTDDRGTSERDPLPASDLLGEFQLQLAHQARARPYTVIFAALGVGYVLGGGVPRWAVRMVTSAGIRLITAQMIAAVLGEGIKSR